MFFTFLSLGASLFGFGKKEQPQFHDSIVGNWTIVGRELTEDPVNVSFNLNIAKNEDNKFSGVLIGEDEDGVPAPVGNIEISLDEDNTTYNFVYSPEGAEAEEPVKFTPSKTQTGYTVLGQYENSTVVMKLLFERFVELTIIDENTKVISTYTLSKEVRS